jgi:hypothetical protein
MGDDLHHNGASFSRRILAFFIPSPRSGGTRCTRI